MSEKLNNTEPSLGQQSIDEFKASINDRKRSGRFIDNNYERYKKLYNLAGQAAVRAVQAEERLANLPTIASLETELDSIRKFKNYEEYKHTKDNVDDMAAEAIAEISDKQLTAHALENHVNETKIHLAFDDKTATKVHKQALKENKKFDKDRQLPAVGIELEATKDRYRNLQAELIDKTLQMKPLNSALEVCQAEYDKIMKTWAEMKPEADAYNRALDQILTTAGKQTVEDGGYHVGYEVSTSYTVDHVRFGRWYTYQGSESYQPDYGRYISIGKAGETLTNSNQVYSHRVQKKRPVDLFEVEMANPGIEARSQIESALLSQSDATSALKHSHDMSQKASRLGAYVESKRVIKQLETEINQLATINLEKIAFDTAINLLDQLEQDRKASERLFEKFPKLQAALQESKTIQLEFERYFRG